MGNYVATALALILLIAVVFVGNEANKQPAAYNTVQTVYVTVPHQGQVLLQEVHDTLLDQCRKIPWKVQPPERPTCEVVAMAAVTRLIIEGRLETQPQRIGHEYD